MMITYANDLVIINDGVKIFDDVTELLSLEGSKSEVLCNSTYLAFQLRKASTYIQTDKKSEQRSVVNFIRRW